MATPESTETSLFYRCKQTHHHCGVVEGEGCKVLVLACKYLAVVLHTLAEAVLRNERDDLLAVLLLGVDPARHLVDVLRVHVGRELVDELHCLRHSRVALHELRHELGVVKNSAGDLAVATTQAKDEVECRPFFVGRKGKRM